MMMKHRIGSWLLAIGVAGVALPISEADAALNAYLKLKGQKQGEIKGSVAQKGREGRIAVIAVTHTIVSPRDPASGLPTGKRQHKPMVITKELDRSTPLLHGALVNNESLTEAVFSVYAPTSKGGDAPVYTIRLSNASIMSIVMRTEADGRLVEDITLAYQEVDWIWTDGGVTTSDHWQVGAVK